MAETASPKTSATMSSECEKAIAKQEETTTSTCQNESDLPRLKFSFRWIAVSLYISFLILCNVIIPVLLYYLLQDYTHISTQELIGISSAALGLSSCFDAPFRLYKLVRYRRTYGPLGSDVWWHLDFVMWTYTWALLVFAFPLAIAPAIAFYDFFLMSTMMLVGAIGVVFVYSLFAFKLPCRCSSETAGTCMKPAVFYVIEDVAAVDFQHGREFRTEIHKRWSASPPFRRLMTHLTIYWSFAAAVYCGITAAVTWASPLNFAFGWVLGQFFLWAGAAALGCVIITKRGLREETRWWEHEHGRKLVKDPEQEQPLRIHTSEAV